jgi:MarR family transcriptional regulator, 2-MHQ and catechol-resistance regulon repressor
MEQFKRFGIDFENDEYVQTSIYGVASVFLLIEKEIENYLKQYNLSSSKFNMMMVVKHQGSENGISQVEIGKRLVVTASNMTKQLDKLIVEGFVERFAQVGDRRVNLIKITQTGSDLLDKIWPGYHETIKNIANLISFEERETLSKILAKWFKGLENS